MDIFDILTMIGGLCMFLFGMNIMGDALERAAGNGLRNLLGNCSIEAGFVWSDLLTSATGTGTTIEIRFPKT